jgi:hypothetical protein
MNAVPKIGMFFPMFLMQLPVLLVCLVAGGVVLAKWKQGAQGSIWAVCGFGLAVFLCVAVPIVQTVVQHWAMQDDMLSQRGLILTASGVLWSLLRAATYALLLIAVFAGRSPSTAANSPP